MDAYDDRIKSFVFVLWTFPNDQDLKKKWILMIRRKDWEPTRNSRVCSRHFCAGVPNYIHPVPTIQVIKSDYQTNIYIRHR